MLTCVLMRSLMTWLRNRLFSGQPAISGGSGAAACFQAGVGPLATFHSDRAKREGRERGSLCPKPDVTLPNTPCSP